jgi:hypothetical protein
MNEVPYHIRCIFHLLVHKARCSLIVWRYHFACFDRAFMAQDVVIGKYISVLVLNLHFFMLTL